MWYQNHKSACHRCPLFDTFVFRYGTETTPSTICLIPLYFDIAPKLTRLSKYASRGLIPLYFGIAPKSLNQRDRAY